MRLRPDMESFQCPYCQRVCLPEKNDDGVRVLGDPVDQQCPLCNLPLVHAVLARKQILYCTGCQGMMIPMPMLEGLIEELRAEHGSGAAPAAGDRDELRRRINCPQCHRPMDAHFYAGGGNVVIDSCEECSLIWMDRGALMRIAHTPAEIPSPEASFAEDSVPLQGPGWPSLGESIAGEIVVDGIVGSFFK